MIAASQGEPGPDRDERELLARIRAGETAAFERLFLTHYGGMCALAYRMVRSREAAEDVVSSVFLRLWKRRRDWSPTGPARTYLLTAARNEALNLIRRVQRERGLGESQASADAMAALATAAASPEDATAERETVAAVERAVATLPRRQRDVFLLRWREALPYREIADRLGISTKTVEMHMTRALREIRALVCASP